MVQEVHAITTTISCSVSGAEGHLSGEIDSRPYGLNGGRSQYFPGDTCYALIYKSVNVQIIGSFVTGNKRGTTFTYGTTAATSTEVGYNIVREGLTFSNPIASFSKPVPSAGTGNSLILLDADFQKNSGDCGGFTYIPGTTVARLKVWKGSGSPTLAQPYAFIFVEYTPDAIIASFNHLAVLPGDLVFSWPVHAVLYGIATPLFPSSNDPSPIVTDNS